MGTGHLDPDLEPFMNVAWGMRYHPKSIFPSEMFMLYKAIRTFNAHDRIFESGVGYGGSTTYLARLFPHTPIVSVDLDKYAELEHVRKLLQREAPHVKLIKGDSRELLPRLVQRSTGRRIAVLIDGPKGKAAMKLMRVLIQLPRVVLVAVHDLHDEHLIHGESSKSPDFRAAYDSLDADVGVYRNQHYPKGPGLTIFKRGKL
jgi:hypothetical protein